MSFDASTSDLEILFTTYATFPANSSREQQSQIALALRNSKELFERDYVIAVVRNPNGFLCDSYPEEMYVAVERGDDSNLKGRKKFVETYARELETVIRESRFSRVHGRFPFPVVFYNGKFVCRSGTISRSMEVLYRSTSARVKDTFNKWWSSEPTQDSVRVPAPIQISATAPMTTISPLQNGPPPSSPTTQRPSSSRFALLRQHVDSPTSTSPAAPSPSPAQPEVFPPPPPPGYCNSTMPPALAQPQQPTSTLKSKHFSLSRNSTPVSDSPTLSSLLPTRPKGSSGGSRASDDYDDLDKLLSTSPLSSPDSPPLPPDFGTQLPSQVLLQNWLQEFAGPDGVVPALFAQLQPHRVADCILLKRLGMAHVFDLMVENHKRKYGLVLCDAEKSSFPELYRPLKTCIEVMPYPGREYFMLRQAYDADRYIVDWVEEEQEAKRSLSMPCPDLSQDLARMGKTDLIEITKNYFRVMMHQFATSRDSSAVLVHCLSGWDRTPLFISMFRTTLWADGLVHQGLDVDNYLYFTVAYDWMLFHHALKERLDKNEQIMRFCFEFLEFIEGDEWSLSSFQNQDKRKSAQMAAPTPTEVEVQKTPEADENLSELITAAASTKIADDQSSTPEILEGSAETETDQKSEEKEVEGQSNTETQKAAESEAQTRPEEEAKTETAPPVSERRRRLKALRERFMPLYENFTVQTYTRVFRNGAPVKQ